MVTRRYVLAPPRLTAVGNADLDVTITLREAVPTASIDDITSTAPQLGELIDLTGFTNLRGQLRARNATDGLSDVDTTDNTARATMAITVLGMPGDGQIRCRVLAERMWAMQQAGVRSGYFDVIGQDADGVTWSLVTGGLFELIPGTTPPFADSNSDPELLDADVFPVSSTEAV